MTQLSGPNVIDPATGKVRTALIPSVAITQPYVVANQAARLALSSAEVGDLAIQSDNGRNYILQTLPASTNGNWIALEVLPYTATTSGGSGNAGKTLVLDADGKAHGRVLSTDGTKLDGIEAGADVTDFGNVSAALAAATGAVSLNGQNLTSVGTVDGRDVSADGTALDAVIGAPVWTSAASSAFSGERNVGALSDGLLKHSSGVPAAAVAGTDYLAPGAIGSTVQAYDPTLSALAAYNTNGLLAQTSADTFAGRTLTGTANQITVSNGDGVSGNPTLSTPQDIHTAAAPTFARLTLSQTTGTAPLTVNSTTPVGNLNADLHDGAHASATPTADTIPIANGSGKLASGWLDTGTSAGQILTTTGADTLYQPIGASGITWIAPASYAATQELLVTHSASTQGPVVFVKKLMDGIERLFLLGNGANASTTFTDGSTYGTVLSAQGNAQISTAQSKFNGSSMRFDGSGDAVTAGAAAAFALGTGPFTVEFWVRFDDATPGADQVVMDCRTAANGAPFNIAINTSGNIYLYDGSMRTFSAACSDATWHHVTLVRNLNVLKGYLDGVERLSVSSYTTNYGTNQPLRLGYGADGGNGFAGYLQAVRMSSYAKYTAAFTPESSAPTALPAQYAQIALGTGLTAGDVGTQQLSATQTLLRFNTAGTYSVGHL